MSLKQFNVHEIIMDEFTTVIVSICFNYGLPLLSWWKENLKQRKETARKTKSIPGGKPHWR